MVDLSAFNNLNKKQGNTSSNSNVDLSAFGIEYKKPTNKITETKPTPAPDLAPVEKKSFNLKDIISKIPLPTLSLSDINTIKNINFKDAAKGTVNLVKGLSKAAINPIDTAKQVKESFIEGTPGFVSNFQRGINVGIEKISPVINKITETLNVPGQLQEFVTKGEKKAPKIKNSVLEEISLSLDKKSNENNEYNKILQSLKPEDTRPLNEKLADPKFLSSLIGTNLPQLGTSLGTGVAASLFGGPIAGTITAFVSSAAQEGGDAYNNAKNFLETSDKKELRDLSKDKKFLQDIAVATGVINGVIDTLPIAEILNKSPQGSILKESIFKNIQKNLLKHGKQALLEGSTESIQELVSNSVAQTYDENRNLFDNVVESFVAGGLLGFGTSVTSDVTSAGFNVVNEAYQNLSSQQKQGGFIKNPFFKETVNKHIAESKDVLSNLPQTEIDKLGGLPALIEDTKKNIVDGLKHDNLIEEANIVQKIDTKNITNLDQLSSILINLTDSPVTSSDIANGATPPEINLPTIQVPEKKTKEQKAIEKSVMPEKTKESVDLKKKLQVEEKAAKKGYKAGAQDIERQLVNTFEARAEAEMRMTTNEALKQKILDRDKYQTKLVETKNKYEATIGDMARESELNRLKTTIVQRMKDQAKKDIVIYAKENLPTSEQGPLISLVSKAETQKDIIKAYTKINKLSEKYSNKKLISEIKSVIGKTLDSKSIAVEYKDLVKQMVSNIDLDSKSSKKIASLNATKAFIDKQIKEGKDVTIPEKIYRNIQALNKYPASELPAHRLETILNNIKDAVEFGKTKYRVNKNIYELEKDKLKKDVIKDIRKISDIKLAKKVPGMEDINTVSKVLNILKKIRYQVERTDKVIMPMDTLFDYMSNGKLSYNKGISIIKNKLDVQYSNYLTNKDEIYQRVYEDIALTLGLDQSNFERIGIYAARQQKGGMEKLINTLTDPDAVDKKAENKRVVDYIKSIELTANETKLYQAMRNEFDALFEPIRKTMREVFGEDVKDVENYFSFMTDFDAMSEYEIQNQFGGQTLEKLTEKGATNTYTKKPELGFTKSRTGGDQKIKLDAMSIFSKHIDDATYLINMARDIKMSFEIINSKEFHDKAGDLGYTLAKEWITLVARKGGTAGRGQIALLDTLRRNLGVAMMGFKLSSMFIQPTSLLDGSALVGGQWVFPAFKDVLIDKKLRDFIYETMPEIRERTGDDPGFKELERSSKLAKIQNVGFAGIKFGDKLAAYAVAFGAYKKKLDELGIELDLDKPNQEAINYAQFAVRKSQASSVFKDLPLALSNGSFTGNKSLDRALFQFQTFMLSRWSLIRYDFPQAIASKNAKQATQIATYLVLANIAEMGIRGLLKGLSGAADDDDKDKEVFSEQLFANLLNNIPFVSQIMGITQYDSGLTPSTEAIKDGLKAIDRIKNAKKESTKNKALIDFASSVGSIGGIPGTSQLRQFAKMLIDDSKKKNKLIE